MKIIDNKQGAKMSTNELISFINSTGTEIFIGNSGKTYLSIYYRNLQLFFELLKKDYEYFRDGESVKAHINYHTIDIELDYICDFYNIDLNQIRKEQE